MPSECNILKYVNLQTYKWKLIGLQTVRRQNRSAIEKLRLIWRPPWKVWVIYNTNVIFQLPSTLIQLQNCRSSVFQHNFISEEQQLCSNGKFQANFWHYATRPSLRRMWKSQINIGRWQLLVRLTRLYQDEQGHTTEVKWTPKLTKYNAWILIFVYLVGFLSHSILFYSYMETCIFWPIHGTHDHRAVSDL